MRRVAMAWLSIVLWLAGCAGPGAPAPNPPAAPFSLTLLHLNDHHSHLDPERFALQLDTGNGREAVDVEHGGFARVAAAIKALAADRRNVIKIHAGDALTGDLYFNLSDGEADAALMNVVCFDSFTLGNHEFDHGDAGLKRFIGFLHAGSCQTPVLSANVDFGAGSPLHSDRARGLVRPSAVIERGGQRIGLVGITIAGKTKHASRPDADTQFGDEAERAQTEINRLRAAGVNKIIVQSHYGYQQDQALAARLDGVDVLVGGDSHTLLGPAALQAYGLSPAGPYPTRVVDRHGKPVCIVQAWQYAYVVGELTVDFDAAGEVTGCRGTPHVLIGDDFRQGAHTLDATQRAAVLADIAAGGVLRITAPDAAAQAALAPYARQREAFGSKVVAQVASDLCLRRVPGSRRDPGRSTLGDACNRDPHGIAHGGDVQQLVAVAFLAQGQRYFGAEIALQNGGGVRVDLPAGEVDVRRIYTALPFRNTLQRLHLSGAELKATLEAALAAVIAGNTGSYPYAAGLRWQVDLNRPEGGRFHALEVKQQGRWVPLEPARSYTLATSDFLADGGDYYIPLKAITGERRLDVGLDYAEAFLAYLDNLPGPSKVLARLPDAEYSTQRFIDTP